MDALVLIEQAQEAGLKLSAVDGQLVMKGPRRLSSLVSLIAQNKPAVLAALTVPVAPSPPLQSQLSTCVGITETPTIQHKSGGFVDSVLAIRRKPTIPRPSWPMQPPVEILADPIVLCPRCGNCRVLSELRTLTSGLCYPCWEGEAHSDS